MNDSNGDSTVPAENLTSFCFEAARLLNFRTVKVVLGRDTKGHLNAQMFNQSKILPVSRVNVP